MDLELKNKEWLPTLKEWCERLKTDELELVIYRSSIIQEFQEKQVSLEKHLRHLVDWLSKNDIKEALKKLPSVGKVLAALCKLPFVFTRDSMSCLVIECILQLSDLLTVEGGTTPEDSQRKRAKKWAIEHFGVITTRSFSGIDHFLMEEFGISQEEFMTNHLRTVAEDLVAAINCVKTDPYQTHHSDREELIQSLFNTLVMIDNDISVSLADNIIVKCKDNIPFDENLTKWLCSDFPRLSSRCLHSILLEDFSVYEQFIMEIIEKVLAVYPLVNQESVLSILSESRLLEIMADDEKLMIGFESIMKECFMTVGNNQVLVNLMRVVTEANGGDGLVSGQRKQQEYASRLVEDLKDLDINNNLSIPEKEKAIFTNWFKMARNYNTIEEVFLSLFSRETEDLRKCMELVVWYHDPFKGLTNNSINDVVNHVKLLKRLVPKKYMELNDIQPLVLNLKKSLHHSLSAILIIMHVLFAANCYGVKAFAKDFIALLSYEEELSESIFWFLSAMDILKKSCAVCKKDILNDCKNKVDELLELQKQRIS